MAISSQPKYRMAGQVGRGQFGRVFCAFDRHGQVVALKELELRRLTTNQFLRELRFLLSLRHANIVSCLALEYIQGRRYLVMEYCEVGTLRNLMDQSQSLRQCLKSILAVLAGLDYAHRQNIIHCDIKPENILLSLDASGWRAKISDFGIARLGQETDRFDSTGSPGYMAPERFYGQFSAASDLYAIGVILYELIVKNRPFAGNPAELMYAHLNNRVQFPPHIPDRVQVFLRKALEKLPARRFQTAAEMQVELVKLLDLLSDLDGGVAYSSELAKVTKKCLVATARVYAEGQYFYCAIATCLTRRNLGTILNNYSSYVFPTEITAIAGGAGMVFVILANGVAQVNANFQEHRLIYAAESEFIWAIAEQWFAVLASGSLRIYRLTRHGAGQWVECHGVEGMAVVKISDRYLGIVSKAGLITVVSRRGKVIVQLSLPVTVVQAISTSRVGRIALVSSLNHLLLVDFYPYRVVQVELGYRPELVVAMVWGYITSHKVQEQSCLSFMDGEGSFAGQYFIDGVVRAIACISSHILVIATGQKAGGEIQLLDLKQLQLDILF